MSSHTSPSQEREEAGHTLLRTCEGGCKLLHYSNGIYSSQQLVHFHLQALSDNLSPLVVTFSQVQFINLIYDHLASYDFLLVQINEHIIHIRSGVVVEIVCSHGDGRRCVLEFQLPAAHGSVAGSH